MHLPHFCSIIFLLQHLRERHTDRCISMPVRSYLIWQVQTDRCISTPVRSPRFRSILFFLGWLGFVTKTPCHNLETLSMCVFRLLIQSHKIHSLTIVSWLCYHSASQTDGIITFVVSFMCVFPGPIILIIRVPRQSQVGGRINLRNYSQV